jgi:predicted DCC family thiol-disulfide oxidoreductase YuxK
VQDKVPQSGIEVFYDGGCPLCRREMAFIRGRDRRGTIRFTDIDAESFDAASYGMDRDTFMSQLHARLPDGTWLRGVEVFRRLYAAIGLGPLVWLTRLPLISQLLDILYIRFARNRLRLTGRCADGACAADRR